MWVRARVPVAERDVRPVAQMLLITWAMRSNTAASTNPWGNTIDDGWKDLVVTSAPPLPPPPPREAMAEPVVRNRPLPAGVNMWQEHGAARAAVVPPVEEPNFTAGDRRLWVIAGSLMAMAALVLGLLGMLTFGGGSSPAATPSPVAAASPRAVEPTRAAEPARAPAVAHATNPRVLKAAAHSSKGRHHKRLATR
jgi:hypothetical protein